jgi:hypothetical protein
MIPLNPLANFTLKNPQTLLKAGCQISQLCRRNPKSQGAFQEGTFKMWLISSTPPLTLY